MATIIPTDAPFLLWDWDIVLDADMHDQLPQFLDWDGVPINMTGLTLEVHVRPTNDHDTLLKMFTSAGATPEITFDADSIALATLHLVRATVKTTFVNPGEWDFFCLLKSGSNYAELGRGPFRVHAGKTA